MEHHLTIAYFTLNGKKRKHLNITIPLTMVTEYWKAVLMELLHILNSVVFQGKFWKKKIIRLHFHLCFYYQYDSLAFIYSNSQTFTPKYNRGSRNDLWAISIQAYCIFANTNGFFFYLKYQDSLMEIIQLDPSAHEDFNFTCQTPPKNVNNFTASWKNSIRSISIWMLISPSHNPKKGTTLLLDSYIWVGRNNHVHQRLATFTSYVSLDLNWLSLSCCKHVCHIFKHRQI